MLDQTAFTERLFRKYGLEGAETLAQHLGRHLGRIVARLLEAKGYGHVVASAKLSEKRSGLVKAKMLGVVGAAKAAKAFATPSAPPAQVMPPAGRPHAGAA